MSTSPSEDELKAALVDLKSANPSLGITKTHALLLATNPTWVVSEKRTRKLLQHEGLVLNGATPPGTPEVIVYPSSHIIHNLDVHRWTPKVKVKYFDKKKGKGLVATQEIKEGEVIWKEDPFILASEWEIYDLQTSSAACGFCSTPLDPSSPLTLPCPSTSSLSPSSTTCPFRFCNRLCFSRSAKHHSLLCPSANPASTPLLKWTRETKWMALHALAQCTSRVLLAGQRGEEEEAADWAVVMGLAEMGMEDRWKHSFRSGVRSEPDRAGWKKAHALFVEAFREPKNPADQKKLARILKKPLNPIIEKQLFDYERGFLRGLGRMSLNLEAHGGLYTLHSHLNHSCMPNVSVRHLEQRTALARITLLAKRAIKPGEELFVTYVNPEIGVRARRRELEAWGFGECVCNRCVEEARVLKEKGGVTKEGGRTNGHELETEDLANELKTGLGVM